MFVRKAFQFRLRPTKAQAKLLQAQLEECRWLYNELLSQRKIARDFNAAQNILALGLDGLGEIPRSLHL